MSGEEFESLPLREKVRTIIQDCKDGLLDDAGEAADQILALPEIASKVDLVAIGSLSAD